MLFFKQKICANSGDLLPQSKKNEKNHSPTLGLEPKTLRLKV